MNKNLLIGIAATLMPAWMQAQSEKPKNVLFIAVDDLNDWVGFLKGHPNTRTPNMDRLAAMGMAAPVSNASRAALLSGFRTSTTGVYGNAEFMRESPVLKDAVTLPKYFSNHGYYSMARGKIFHQPMGPWGDPQSWDSQENLGGLSLNPPRQKADQVGGKEEQPMDWKSRPLEELWCLTGRESM